jgi:hypothetical protein
VLLCGPDGMGFCTWQDGGVYDSDVSNLTIASREAAKAVAPGKRKKSAKSKAAAKKAKAKAAAAKAKAAAKADDDDDDDSSDDTGESSEEEGEEVDDKGGVPVEDGEGAAEGGPMEPKVAEVPQVPEDQPPRVKVESEQLMPAVQIKSELPQQLASESKPVSTVDFPTMHCQLHSTSPHDADQSVPLEPGPHGLLIAKFGELVHKPELSNLMLAVPPPSPHKKRPAAAVAKKPAACILPETDAAEVEAAEAEAEAALPGADYGAPVAADYGAPANDYGVMWYKRSRAIGIRQKFGSKAQVFSFGGKSSPKTERELKDFAEVLVKDLRAGASVAATRNKGRKFACHASQKTSSSLHVSLV